MFILCKLIFMYLPINAKLFQTSFINKKFSEIVRGHGLKRFTSKILLLTICKWKLKWNKKSSKIIFYTSYNYTVKL